mmetsp:Transcript_61821/g.127848  ORF Transcript_61821/g.127848 Transcript_61821/m.127848 type:complete len:215 (+) Transcript_61821:222-866(+)
MPISRKPLHLNISSSRPAPPSSPKLQPQLLKEPEGMSRTITDRASRAPGNPHCDESRRTHSVRGPGTGSPDGRRIDLTFKDHLYYLPVYAPARATPSPVQRRKSWTPLDITTSHRSWGHPVFPKDPDSVAPAAITQHGAAHVCSTHVQPTPKRVRFSSGESARRGERTRTSQPGEELHQPDTAVLSVLSDKLLGLALAHHKLVLQVPRDLTVTS